MACLDVDTREVALMVYFFLNEDQVCNKKARARCLFIYYYIAKRKTRKNHVLPSVMIPKCNAITSITTLLKISFMNRKYLSIYRKENR